MKWTNHEVAGYALAYAVTGDIVLSLVSLPMSVMPDLIEGAPEMKYLKHRGWSHNIMLWSLFSAVSMALGYFVFSLHFALVAAAIIGLLSHLFFDACTISGIPLWKHKIFKAGLFRTGSVGEYIIAFSVLAAALGYRLLYLGQPRIQIEYSLQEIRLMFYVLTQPHFAKWLISVLPYTSIAIVALVVAVWMIVFRELFTYGMGIIVVAIVLFFIGQSLS